MTPTQIKQALNIRMLRADKAERALRAARTAESQAISSVSAVEGQLSAFDASFESRIAAFFEKTSDGTRPESLHSARSFHADLAGERAGIEALIAQAWRLVDVAREQTAEARGVWMAASRAADNLKDIQTETARKVQRAQERLEEQDADEMSIARAYRNAG